MLVLQRTGVMTCLAARERLEPAPRLVRAPTSLVCMALDAQPISACTPGATAEIRGGSLSEFTIIHGRLSLSYAQLSTTRQRPSRSLSVATFLHLISLLRLKTAI